MPGLEFSNKTIIYGKNTEGKSTLTCILRSLQTGNNDLVIGRKSFGSTTAKKIEIDFEINSHVKKYSFQNKKWNESFPGILIFDSKFISENIFDGETISYGQQKSLNQIIIGEEGRILKDQIDGLQKKSDDMAIAKREKTTHFTKHFIEGADFEETRRAVNITDVDKRIQEQKDKIAFQVVRDKLKVKLDESILYFQKMNFSEFALALNRTLQTKQDEIERHMQAHWNDPNHSMDFLREGHSLLKDEGGNCVFCGQILGTDALSLIKAYGEFFRGDYQALQKDVNERGTKFRAWNIESVLLRLKADFKALGVELQLSDATITALATAKANVDVKVQAKQADLNYSLNLAADEDAKLIVTELEKVKEELLSLKTEKIEATATVDIQQLKRELAQLEEIQKRFEPAWASFFIDYEKIEKDAEEIRTERDKLRKSLDEYSQKIFEKHKACINKFLKEMGADFEVSELKPLKKMTGQSERIFALKFFGSHPVNIDEIFDSKPNFKNTLSESDKRCLAFAFFLSLAATDNKLNNKILVFDDPISSFDDERKRKTIYLLADICYEEEVQGQVTKLEPLQKIILTHDKDFCGRLCSDKSFLSAVTLKIIPDGVTNGHKKSTIERCNIEEEFLQDECIAIQMELKKVLDENAPIASFGDFCQKCRKVLEHLFKRKYCFQLSEASSKKQGPRTFVEVLANEKIGGFEGTGNRAEFVPANEKAKCFIRLCDDLNIELHDNNQVKSDGDQQSILRDFFACVQSI
ncbi:MAG: AAA family ATPase [Candidatus Peribacter sp.]|nr:AAA family ATPase [Candidatus Peribacter sp.]